MRGYTTVKLKSRGIGQPRRKRAIKLAFNTNQMQALPKARLKPESERAAEMTAAERMRSGQRIQGAMRQQPCAPNNWAAAAAGGDNCGAPTSTCRGLVVAENNCCNFA